MTRLRRLTAVLLALWVGTLLWVLDTRTQFSRKTVHDAMCTTNKLAASSPPTWRRESTQKSSSLARHRVNNSNNQTTGIPNKSSPKSSLEDGREKELIYGEIFKLKEQINTFIEQHQQQTKQQQTKQQQHSTTNLGPAAGQSSKPINPHPFVFTLNNPEVCKLGANANGYVDALCLVYTAPDNVDMRTRIRRTWASVPLVRGKRFVTMFLLGQRSANTQRKLQAENDHYHDIVQENFVDSYHNLTVKTIMGMKWASEYCPNARYIVKIDIDMFVNVYNLADRIDTAPSASLAEGTRKGITQPIRNNQSKWYTSRDVYPENDYPPYLNGPAYLISGDLAGQIYRESFHVRFLPWEDAFVGIVMKRLKVEPRNSNKYDFYLDYSDEKSVLRKIKASITFHLGEDKVKNKDRILKVWKYTQQINSVTASVPTD